VGRQQLVKQLCQAALYKVESTMVYLNDRHDFARNKTWTDGPPQLLSAAPFVTAVMEADFVRAPQ
jgi:hypothetical protein